MKNLQSSVVTQTVLDGLAIYLQLQFPVL